MTEFKKYTVELDPEKVDKFRENHPGTSIKWFFDCCLESYDKITKAKGLNKLVQESFDEAVSESIERLEEGGVRK